jgi:hypothetical protein
MGRRKTEREKAARRKAHRLEGQVHRGGGAILRSRRGAVVHTVPNGPMVVPGANSVAKPHVRFDGMGVDTAESPSVSVAVDLSSEHSGGIGIDSSGRPFLQMVPQADPPGGTVNGDGEPRHGTTGVIPDAAPAVAAGREIELNDR